MSVKTDVVAMCSISMDLILAFKGTDCLQVRSSQQKKPETIGHGSMMFNVKACHEQSEHVLVADDKGAEKI